MAYPRLLTIALLPLALAACGDPGIFARVDAPESADVAAAPWPRLADTPPAPPQGVYDETAPDPAIGAATRAELAARAESMRTRRRKLSGPVE